MLSPNVSVGTPSVFSSVNCRFVSRWVPSGYLIWRTTPGGPFHPDWGRPYFLFDLENNNARLVGMGSNRMYEAGTGDDLVVYLLK